MGEIKVLDICPLKKIRNPTQLEKEAWEATCLGLSYGRYKWDYPAGLPAGLATALRERKPQRKEEE